MSEPPSSEDDGDDLPPMILDPPWGGDQAAWRAYRDLLRTLPPSVVRDMELETAEAELAEAPINRSPKAG